MLQSNYRLSRSIRTGMLLLFVSILLFSCQKDRPLSLAESNAQAQSNPNFWGEYDRVGADLERAFSYAAQDLDFKLLILYFTQEMVDGDYEVLLTDLMNVPMQAGGTALDYFLSLSNQAISETDLRAFMNAHPATILGVRGDPSKWVNGMAIPPVKFVPHGFQESTQLTTASLNGLAVPLDLSSAFDEAVLVLMKSERHDDNGNHIVSYQKGNGNRQAVPGIGASQANGPIHLKTASDPEPTSCPAVLPTIVSFNAIPENGGMKLVYNISDFPTSLGSWGRVVITRTNPDNSTEVWYRFAEDPNFFYDSRGSSGVTYTYQINAYVAYQEPSNGQWVTCPSNNNLLLATAQYPKFGALVESFTGSNQSNSSIRYDWVPPADGIANEYRIRRATPTGYVTMASGIPGTQYDYFYTPIPFDARGTLVETQIQYRASGPWQGNFFDRTYASHRNPGEPLYFTGIRMDLAAFESTENPLYGSPEIRLTALRANAAEETDTPVQTFIQMTGCTTPVTRYDIDFRPSFWSLFLIPPRIILVTLQQNTGYYYPKDSPGGYEILSGWSSDLYGSAVTISLKETDINVKRITEETNTETFEIKPSAEFGFKVGEVEGSKVGIESTWRNAKETTILYPASDLDLEVDKIIYYHEPRVLTKGRAMFSTQRYTDPCTVLEQNL